MLAENGYLFVKITLVTAFLDFPPDLGLFMTIFVHHRFSKAKTLQKASFLAFSMRKAL